MKNNHNINRKTNLTKERKSLKMLELDKFQTDTFTFNLVLPTGEISKAEITVRADSHPKVKEVSRNLILESEQRRATQKRRGKKPEDALTEEDLDYLEEAGLKRAVSRVASMKGVSEGGKEVGEDEQLIAKVLKTYPWIVEQIGEQSNDAGNFCRKSAPASA
ncbi:MAG: hypothetical protein ACRDBG_18220 [Waterburya sp.]